MKPPESKTYQILEQTSLARIEREWSLSDSQRVVMRTMVLLSYSEGQSWALVPCQAKLATALRCHKATVSRAIRSCIMLGILERHERQNETLYRVMPNAQGVPAVANDESESAMRELVELQRTRLQGTAEGSGQLRLSGILPSEEIDAPAEALEAALSMPQPETAEESDEQFHARLEAMARSAPPTVKPKTSTPEVRANVSPRTTLDWTPAGRESRDARFSEGARGLDAEQLRIMRELRSEFRATNQRSEDDFLKYVYRWKREVVAHPALMEEIIAKHAALRSIGQGFDSAGKFVQMTLRTMGKTGAAAKLDSS